MSISRRSFTKALGLAGVTGVIWAPAVAARGREALAAELPGLGSDIDARLAAVGNDVIRLSSNENPRGPSRAALDGIEAALGFCSRYPSGAPTDLRAAVAGSLGVPTNQVMLACGSTELLRVAVDAFAGPGRPLVTAIPTFEEAPRRAERMGIPVREIPVDAALRMNLDAMAEASSGAGLVFLCNPNNPTSTVHGAQAVERFVKQVHARSPSTVVLIDEAYHEYSDAHGYETAMPLALNDSRVVISRTFSKAYGIAGLRVGYAVAHEDTLAAMIPYTLGGLGINVIGAAAAAAALEDNQLPERERALNAEARDFTVSFFRGAGYEVADSSANFVMVDVRRPAREFQAACRELNVQVGRRFPPLENHSRISIGTMDEMREAVAVFSSVLGVRAGRGARSRG